MNQKRFRRSGMTALAAAIAAATGQAGAATFEVTTKDASGEGSLAAAITAANGTPGADDIQFSVGGTINLANTSLPAITDELTITGNGIRLEGGAAYAENSVLRVYSENVSISGLTITGANQGAIDIDGAYDVTLRDVVVSSTGSGDELANGHLITVDSSEAYFENVTIKGNTIGGGSPLAVFEGSDVSGSGLTVTGNSFYGEAGVSVYFGSDLDLVDSVISGNENLGFGAGGMAVKYGSEAFLEGVEVSKNRGTLGGGAAVKYGSRLYTYDTSFSSNYAEYSGGGISAQYAELSLIATEITGNSTSVDESAGKYFGGGLTVGRSYLYAEGLTVTKNRSVSGGGMLMFDTANAIKYSQFSNNRAVIGGGMLVVGSTDGPPIEEPLGFPWTAPGSLRLIGSSVTGNTATTSLADSPYAGVGGGIFAVNMGYLFPKYSTISNNSATKYGGGIFAPDNEAFGLWGSSVTGNAAEFGGGLLVDSEDVNFFKYADISNNTASGGAGAGYLEAGDVNFFKYSTIADNRASDGPALVVYAEQIDMEGSTISGNRGGNGPAVEFEGYSDFAEMEVVNSTFSGNVSSDYRAAIVTDVKYVEVAHSTFVNNAGSGAMTAQLHVAGKYGPGGNQAFLRDSVFTSSNDLEVIGGSNYLEDGGGYNGADLNVVVTANIMTNGLAIYGEGEQTNNFGAIPSDPMLGALTLNGGITETHAPLPGSPVIDLGSRDRPTGGNSDQRGAEQEGPSDLGSVEYITTNTAPRLTKNIAGGLSGTVGRVIDGESILDAFVDDEGDTISLDFIRGGVPGLEVDEDGIVTGELTTPGDYTVTVGVADDGDPSLTTVVQAVVKVRESAPLVFIDDDDDDTLGSFPLALLSLSAAMGWLRRRRR